MTTPILSIRNVSKSFGAIHALRGVDFDLFPGEIHAIAGENGAGKSTLMNIIDGILQPDDGDILIDGRAVTISSPARAQELGIGFVHQEIALCPEISVAENIFMSRTNRRRALFMDFPALVRQAREFLEPLAQIDPAAPASSLSISQQQLVEIAKALTLDCRILILDEPTAALTEHEAGKLFEIMHRLADGGMAIIYITHRMAEIFGHCDRVTVFRDGQHIRTENIVDITTATVVHAMVGRQIDRLYPAKLAGPPGADILLVEVLSGARYNDISFALRKGEILGFAGLIGAGRSEIVKGICRLEDHPSGRIVLNGREISPADYADCIGEGIVYLSEDRKGDGVFLDLPIAVNISALRLRQIAGPFGFIDRPRETAQAEKLGRRLHLKAQSVAQKVSDLSGGNQQKVSLAKLLAVDPRVVFLDEPTRGVDVGAKAEIHLILRGLAEQGVGIAVISSELPELIGLCDRVIVISEGRVAGELAGEDMTEPNIMTLAAHAGTTSSGRAA